MRRSIPTTLLALALGAGLTACAPPGAPPPEYPAIFVEDRLVIWELDIGTDEWIRLLVDPDEYVPARLRVDGEDRAEVGLRILGSPDRSKVSLRVRFDQFDPGGRFFGVKRLNLHAAVGDTSMIREALALDRMQACGVPAPRASFVWLSSNRGFGGVYTLVEQVDRKFLADRFGENDGNLYKGERGARLLFPGDDPALYPDALYEAKTNEELQDRSDLVCFARLLNQTPAADLPRVLSRVLDVEGFLRWLAVNTWLVAMDSYAGTVDNYYLYRGSDGRFHFIPWDLTRAFGNYHGEACFGGGAVGCPQPFTADDYLTLDPDAPVCPCSAGQRPLIERSLEVEEFRERYRELLDELIDGPLAPELVEQRMLLLRGRIAQAALEDELRDCRYPPCTEEKYLAALDQDDPPTGAPDRVPGLKPFVRARDQVIRAELAAP